MAATAVPLVLPPGPVARRPGTWGMGLLIATEASLFGYLLFSYFYVGALARGSWPPSGPPELRLALPNTFVLLLSSATMYWAESGIRHGRAGRLRLGLLATFALGAAFLTVQVMEYRNNPVRPTTSAYGSLFFTVTGFHGAHVAIGLLMIAAVALRAFLGHFRTGRHEAVTNVSWYWHFVDVVWLVVFTSLYLAPRLG
jgi:heme/copper-type cytochrome/quinol oxidase subunit 3